MKFIKDFLLGTAAITVAAVAIFYVVKAGISFLTWELPSSYWHWGVFRGTVLFGMFFGAWFAIDQAVDTVKKKETS